MGASVFEPLAVPSHVVILALAHRFVSRAHLLRLLLGNGGSQMLLLVGVGIVGAFPTINAAAYPPISKDRAPVLSEAKGA
jgi:hypothetical protein